MLFVVFSLLSSKARSLETRCARAKGRAGEVESFPFLPPSLSPRDKEGTKQRISQTLENLKMGTVDMPHVGILLEIAQDQLPHRASGMIYNSGE